MVRAVPGGGRGSVAGGARAIRCVSSAAALVAVFLCGSCRSAGGLGLCRDGTPLSSPTPGIVMVRFENLTRFHTSAVLTLRLRNGNGVPVTIDGGVFGITLNGVDMGRALMGRRVILEGEQDVVFDLPLRICNIGLLLNHSTVTESGRVDYGIQATLYAMVESRRGMLTSASSGHFVLPEDQRSALAAVGAAAPRS
ncbi:MAG: hypothetical protein JXR77_03995 [Lentisphaeria bacterium]|nr:hypothetical protein [Lentisphaeria bacterium]